VNRKKDNGEGKGGEGRGGEEKKGKGRMRVENVSW
jgi:hypothetical protein